ncbi:MAG TPA: iron-containing redox enzyme family protein [Blastocatellia bacterium]|jgi:pyrroloquinoline quinone (PQQ) biosynthesis protein C|nr:iron-containing redox enzyme family protein [Blastocatellia bacterium]
MSTNVTTTTDPEKNIESIEAIRKRADAKRMLKESFFTYIKRNRLTAEQQREFFLQYYTIVKTSYRMLAAGILSTPPEDVDTVEHLVKFLETESGGHPNHLGHYVRWAESFGVSKESLAAAVPNARSRDFDETLMKYFSSEDCLVKQAAQVGLEDCAEVLIDGLDKGFKKYPMSAKAYGYLAIHRLLENDEEGHSRWAIDSIAKNPELNSRLDEVERIYNRVYDIFSGVFQGIFESWGVAESAAA